MAQQIYRRDLHGRNAAVIFRFFLKSLFRCESKLSLLCPENGNQISLSATTVLFSFPEVNHLRLLRFGKDSFGFQNCFAEIGCSQDFIELANSGRRAEPA